MNRSFNKFRKQQFETRLALRTWGEKRGEKWVILQGNEYGHVVVSTHSTKEEMQAVLVKN